MHYYDDTLKVTDFARQKSYDIVDFYVEHQKYTKNRTISNTTATKELMDLIPKVGKDSKAVEANKELKNIVFTSKEAGETFKMFNQVTMDAYLVKCVDKLLHYDRIEECKDTYVYKSPDGGLKVYKPNSEVKEDKWRTLVLSKYYDGEWLLNPNTTYDVVFITTSRKDSMTIYQFGISVAINPFTSEHDIIDISDLRLRYNIKEFICIRDNDLTGEQVGKKYTSQGCIVVSTPEGKDPYEFLILRGESIFQTWIENLLNVYL